MPKSSVFWFALTASVLLAAGLVITCWQWDWLRSGGSEPASNGETLRNAGLHAGRCSGPYFCLVARLGR